MKEGWEIKKLGEVCDILGGSTPKRTESLYWDNGTYPWFTIEDIREQGHIIFDTKQKVTKIAWDKLRIFPKDTIMLCCTASLGEYAITKIQLSSNQQFNGLIIKDKNYLSPMYLMHFCATLKNKLYALSGKATIDFVSAEKVKQISIPVPPIAEQEKIVAELDCLSEIIEKKKQQLKEYDALAQSIFYEMFGDPVENDKGWDISYLKEIAEFKNGLNFKKVENGRKQLFLGVSNFKDNSIINQIEEYSSINIADDITEEFLLKDNDIVFVRSNGSKELVGRNIIVYTGNEKITYSGFCIRCRIISSVIIPIFLNYMLSVPSIKQVIKNFGRGANISNLNQTMLGQIKVIVPPLTLQQYYISKIEAIERQKALIKKSIEEVETLFNSRMDLYFN